jgi:hypothetical protein
VSPVVEPFSEHQIRASRSHKSLTAKTGKSVQKERKESH